MIYALLALALTNIVSLAVFAWYLYLDQKEKSKTINALIAKSSQDFSNFELSDKREKVPTQKDVEDEFLKDYTPVENLDDEEFDEKVLNNT